MNALAVAGVIASGGLGEIGTALPYALAAAAAALTAAGIFSVLLFKGIARWRQIRGEAGGDTLAEFGGTSDAEIARNVTAWQPQEGDRHG
jgi:hypothetical protein